MGIPIAPVLDLLGKKFKNKNWETHKLINNIKLWSNVKEQYKADVLTTYKYLGDQ